MAAQFAYYDDGDLDYGVDFRTDETPISKRLLEAARGELSARQKQSTQARYRRGGGSRINGVHRRGTKRNFA